MTIALLAALILINVWLLTIVHRQRVRKQLPWFASYIVWQFVVACIQLSAWIISPRLYVAVYWWTEGVEILLTVGAVRESFLRIFGGFTAKPVFRWSVWGVIASVVVYSAWKAIYAPPIRSSRLVAFIVDAEFAFRWGIAGIWLLTMALMWWASEPMGSREDAVVTGFGLVSAGTLLNIASRSLFGTKFIFLTKYLPTVGYFAAAWLWLRTFSRPLPEFGFKELGMGPEDILKEMGRYRQIIGWFRRTKW